MKFLVLWELDLSRMRGDFATVIMRMPEYAQKTRERGKLVARYHNRWQARRGLDLRCGLQRRARAPAGHGSGLQFRQV